MLIALSVASKVNSNSALIPIRSRCQLGEEEVDRNLLGMRGSNSDEVFNRAMRFRLVDHFADDARCTFSAVWLVDGGQGIPPVDHAYLQILPQDWRLFV